MTMDASNLREFVESVDLHIPIELKKFVDDFVTEEGRNPMVEEFYRLVDYNLGLVRYGGFFPISEEELRHKRESLSVQILRRLETVYGGEELKELTCSVLTDLERESIPVPVLTLVYLLTDLMEKDARIFDCLCEATTRFKDIIWNELLFGLLRRHAPEETDMVLFAVKLLKSRDYRHRDIAKGLLYCTAYLLKGGLITTVLEAYKTAYDYEFDEETKSPYPDEKDRCVKQIKELSQQLKE